MVITVERTGKAPLSFHGELLGAGYAAVDRRSYSVRVYETAAREVVLAATYESGWVREPVLHWAAHSASTLELHREMSAWDIVPAGVGYPVGDRYAAKQDRLVSELKAAFAVAVSRAFKESGLFEEI